MKLKLKHIAKNLYWNLYGMTLKNPAMPSKVHSILFICKGNICRSPFAEHISRKYALKSNSFDLSSAGLCVDAPKIPPREAIISAAEFGVDLHDHKSKSVSYAMMETFDMVIVMETWQYKYLRNIFSAFIEKIYLLPIIYVEEEVTSSYYKYNIIDPYDRSIPEYIDCYKRIERCVSKVFDNIQIC